MTVLKISGFQNANSGCCGGFGLCLPFSPFACPDASTYVFWDFVHPTEKTYRIIVSDVLNKTLSSFSWGNSCFLVFVTATPGEVLRRER